MTRGLVIRTQELGGQIVALGGDHARGITVETENFTADMFGPAGGTLTLKRDPHVQWPDLRAHAPVTILDRGQVVMRGRIKNTPMTDGGLARQISLQIEGMQFHLDDDAYTRTYVDSNLASWADWRSSLAAPLGSGLVCASGQVSADGGALTLMFPGGTLMATNDTVVVLYDGGPDAEVRAWTIAFDTSANSAGHAFYLSYMSTPDAAGATALVSHDLVTWGASVGPVTYTIPAGYRYLLAQMQYTTTPGTSAYDVWVRIKQSIEYADAAYEAGNASALLASTVLNDALDRATLKLSPDRSLIVPTSFFIPELPMSRPSTPREVGSTVNDYHGWQLRVRPDLRPEFRPLPALPSIEVGADSLFNETSAGDASEVYTGVIVSYTDAAGVQQRVYRSQPVDVYEISAIQPSNPGAEVNTANWTAGGGTLSRTTTGGEFSAGVGGFKLVSGIPFAGVSAYSSVWSGGSFVAGEGYRLSVDVRCPSLAGLGGAGVSVFGDAGQLASATAIDDGTFHRLTVDWVQPRTSLTRIAFGFFAGTAGVAAFFDNIALSEGAATIVNRWGFRRTYRLDVGVALTPAAAEIIGDAFLASHQRTPLKGDLIIPGNGLAWRTPSGQGMRCSEFLGETGELVRMAHLIDPDTGKKGRIGRIVAAAWDPPSGTAKLSIDSTSGNFQALLARLGVQVGQVR